MKALLVSAVVAAALLAPVAQLPAAPVSPQVDVTKCLVQTRAKALNTSAIVAGLGLTPDQVREVRARLTQYGGPRYQGLNDLGLTGEQLAAIERRINAQVAAWNRYPLGWPCAPFKNRTRVVKWMKAKLIANGFRPAMTFTNPSPRQIQFQGVQDGVTIWGMVAKSGPRQIAVRLTAVGWGESYRFNLGFEP